MAGSSVACQAEGCIPGRPQLCLAEGSTKLCPACWRRPGSASVTTGRSQQLTKPIPEGEKRKAGRSVYTGRPRLPSTANLQDETVEIISKLWSFFMKNIFCIYLNIWQILFSIIFLWKSWSDTININNEHYQHNRCGQEVCEGGPKEKSRKQRKGSGGKILDQTLIFHSSFSI